MKVLSKLKSQQQVFHTTTGKVILNKNEATEISQEQYKELIEQPLFKTYVDSKLLEVLGNDSVSTTVKPASESDDSTATTTPTTKAKSAKTDS